MVNNKKPNILLIDRCLNIHKKIFPLVNEICVITEKNDEKPNGHKDFGYKQIIEVDSITHESIIELASSLIKSNNISHILSFDDKYQEVAGRVARKHGLWFPYDQDVCYTVRNKAKTREILKSSGLDNLPCKIVNNENEINKFIKDYKFPIVIKPLSSQGSLAVSIIDDYVKLETAIQLFEKNAKNQTMLVEKYIEGREYSFECFSENGNHKLICVVEKFKSNVYCVGLGHRIPASLSPIYLAETKKFVFSCLNSLGITNGPTHTELILSDSGPIIVETHTRASGANVPYLIENLYNIDIQTLWIHQFLGEKVLHNFRNLSDPKKTGVIWFKHSQKEGILDKIEGITEAYDTFGALKIEAIQTKFKTLESYTKRSEDRLAYAIVIEKKPNDALNKAKAIIDSLKVVYI